jgi:hypothetical protein
MPPALHIDLITPASPIHHPPAPPPPISPPQVKGVKKAKFTLGVYEAKLGSAIQEATNIPCACNEYFGELLRGIRGHFTRYIEELKDADLKRAQLGLAHSYSRAKVGDGCWETLLGGPAAACRWCRAWPCACFGLPSCSVEQQGTGTPSAVAGLLPGLSWQNHDTS